MELLSNLPIEVVKHILSYNRWFSVKPLNLQEYANVINSLLNRPRIITVSNTNMNTEYFRSFVRFNGWEIEYTNYSLDYNELTYRVRNGGDTVYKMIIK